MTDLPPVALPGMSDTVYLCVADADGNSISFINSLFAAFGSGIMARNSGVLFHNRGIGFSLDPGHPNEVAPGKRPAHTIIPAMMADGDTAIMPFGVMGGHFQAFGHAHFVTNVVDFGLDIQEAIDLPRIFHFDGVLLAESGVPDDVCAALSELGHRVERTAVPHGGAQAILMDRERGVLLGASDPRKDGIALGY
jgi:gamma-glutamyltranspeptidase/glutathione hydrolase